MLPQPATVRQPPDVTSTCKDLSVNDIGVGIDTSRYGHYAAFLDDQLQQAAAEREAQLLRRLGERELWKSLHAAAVRLYVPFPVGDTAARILSGSRGGGLSVR